MTDPKITDQHRACAQRIWREMSYHFLKGCGSELARQNMTSKALQWLESQLARHFPTREPKGWMEECAKTAVIDMRHLYPNCLLDEEIEEVQKLLQRTIASHAPDIIASTVHKMRAVIMDAKDSELYREIRYILECREAWSDAEKLAKIGEALAKIEAEGKAE